MQQSRLIPGYSLEVTSHDVKNLAGARALIPPGSSISVTYLPTDTFEEVLAAVREVTSLGYKPVPHLACRRIISENALSTFLQGCREIAGSTSVFIVAGDLPKAMGPYEDTLTLIRSGLLQRAGIRRVGVAGHPGGHPAVSEEVLEAALVAKYRQILNDDLECEIYTQFSFDAEPILSWLQHVRRCGIDAPVRIGIPGPASVKTLLKFAARCGVGTSARVVAKYGLSIGKLLTTAGPDDLIRELEERLDRSIHGEVRSHLYPFGGLVKTAEWADNYARAHVVA